MKSIYSKITFLFRMIAWIHWDTREGIENVRRGLDWKSRRILSARRREKQPRWPSPAR